MRKERSRAAIKDALLALLSEKGLSSLTMSELAARAGVSRSTLYSHYSNVRDVFNDAVRDFCARLRPLDLHLRCSACEDGRGPGIPFCIALRQAEKYEALVREPSFLQTLLQHCELTGSSRALQDDTDPSASESANRILTLFQMSGCYAVAMQEPKDSDWEPTQRLIDAYIRGGINAIRRP